MQESHLVEGRTMWEGIRNTAEEIDLQGTEEVDIKKVLYVRR